MQDKCEQWEYTQSTKHALATFHCKASMLCSDTKGLELAEFQSSEPVDCIKCKEFLD
jgi:hypothetical protein